MSLLFTPHKIGSLSIPNRLIRSATAERMSDDDGTPLAALTDCYRKLAAGGVGLIISGHLFVHPTGKAHPEMTGAHTDAMIPGLKALADAVHKEGGLLAAQINHGGMNASAWHDTIAPSSIQLELMASPAREMSSAEIEELIRAFGLAANRVKQAGFDAVQIHAAHGYLISQFLSPVTNLRKDHWGGDFDRRMNFLREVTKNVRQNVGGDYPVMIKLGMEDGLEGGLAAIDGANIASALENMGIDAVEISSGIGAPRKSASRKGIRNDMEEAYFLPLAKMVRKTTRLPIALVGGIRSRRVMDSLLDSGDVDFVSLCRPLIREPDLPNRLKAGTTEQSACISANNCWPQNTGEGIACKCLK